MDQTSLIVLYLTVAKVIFLVKMLFRRHSKETYALVRNGYAMVKKIVQMGLTKMRSYAKNVDANLIDIDVIMDVVYYGQVFVTTFRIVQIIQTNLLLHANTCMHAIFKTINHEIRKTLITPAQKGMKEDGSVAIMENVLIANTRAMGMIIVEIIQTKLIVRYLLVYLELVHNDAK